MASLRSILALNPPLTHWSAAALPPRMPRRIIDRPKIAAATTLTPRMTGVAMEVEREEESKLSCDIICGRVISIELCILTLFV